MPALLVSEEDPIELNGTLDGSGDLQLLHDSDSLADYDQALHGEHTDLENPSGVVQIRIYDFTESSTSWTIAAEHDPGSGTVNWSRGSNYAYYDFGPMTSEQIVDVTASDGSSPPTTKTRRVRLKVTPPDAQPDRPR